ncbi:hypothetical protein GQ55_2G214400 [Panicum hallii var. hallii]|uniref:Uncharacterized protein n=1 Tax=Panicum hallii var. hallii TaxID=1504633 RepID=A0A2T7ER28_9POAL|nr:hypothetical protein GQ55_2G214400 [Panicum hallii var. hallii]
MSFILSCDFWFCCGSANDPECQPPPLNPQPTQPQTQVVTVLHPPGQLVPHKSSDQMPPPLPAPALPPTIVYNLQPPGTTPSPHVPNGKAYYLPPPKMDQPAWPSATPPSHASPFKEYNVPQPVTQQPSSSFHSTLPSKAYDPLPPSVKMIPSHVPFTKEHEPVMSQTPPQTDRSASQARNTCQTPSITNQQMKSPKVPSKRHETIVPTLVPMHAPTPAPSKVHNPLQQSEQAVLHTDVFDEPSLSDLTSQPPAQAVYPARQPSKTYKNLPSMNQQSMLPHVASKRNETPILAVAPTLAHPPVPSKVHDPLAQSKKTVLSCLPSNKAHDEPPPAQVSSQPPSQVAWHAHQPSKTCQKLPSMDQELVPPHAPSKRYEPPVQAVVQTKSLKDANFSMEYYSEAQRQEYFLMDGCQQYY